MLIERALLAALDADCHSPVAALAQIDGDKVTLRAELLSEDGREHVMGDITGSIGETDLAQRLARDLLDRAPTAVRALFAA